MAGGVTTSGCSSISVTVSTCSGFGVYVGSTGKSPEELRGSGSKAVAIITPSVTPRSVAGRVLIRGKISYGLIPVTAVGDFILVRRKKEIGALSRYNS